MRERLAVRHVGWLAGLALMAAAPAFAGTIGLGWDPVPGALGYRVYYGPSSGQYTGFVDVGATTAVSLDGFADCSNHYVAVKAYNSLGESVGFSNEVSGWPRPQIGGADPAVVVQGSQITLNLTGSNFQSGAGLVLDGSDLPTDLAGTSLVRVDNVTVVSCEHMQALLSVEPLVRGVRAMQVGAFHLPLEVRNTDSVFGARSVGLEVLFDPARCDINRSSSATEDRADGSDLAWLAYAHGSSEGGSYYNPDADLDGDGLVDGVDLALLAARFGMCWDGAEWSDAACH